MALTWQPPRRIRYEHGTLVDARAWGEDGTPRPTPDAEAQAAADKLTDRRLYDALETLVRDHMPHCD